MINQFGKIISSTPEYARMFDTASRVATTNVPVLITGETGTGKEVFARALHEHSHLPRKKFITVNCAAIPENLIESELFGHRKGSFTGATSDKEGKFAAADGGTLFLDEIGDMPLLLQAKMLRASENGEIERLGDARAHKVDVRIVAATNKDLEAMVASKEFREDLLYRLNVVHFHMLPLRDRLEDLHLIINQLILECNEEMDKEVKEVSVAALGILQTHSWPGNIRELRNVIRRAMALVITDHIWVEDLPVRLQTAEVDRDVVSPDSLVSLKEHERHYIHKVLKHTGWNKSRSAEILDISRTTLYEKMKKYGLTAPE